MAFTRPLITTFTKSSITPPSPFLLTQHRSKHSATQVKRLFKNNPARLRILKKAAVDKPKEQVVIPKRTYLKVFEPKFLMTGWSAPPPPEFKRPAYPFHVKRTGEKPFGAAGFLPVYRDVRIHGTKHTTIIRNVTGDIPAFLDELQAVLKMPPPKKILNTYDIGGTGSYKSNASRHGGGEAGRGVNKENPIRIRAGGTIEVNGDVAKRIRQWLAGLGF